MKTQLALVIAAAIALPALALAQAPEPPKPVIAPAWSAEPSLQAIKAGRPKLLGPDGAAFAVLTCTVGEEGALAGCQPAYETPRDMGVADAAIALADQYRAQRPWGALVLFPVVFNPDRARLDQAASGDPGLLRNIAAALTRPPRTEPSLTILACQLEDSGAVQACQTAYVSHIDPELAAHQIGQARAETYAPATRPQPLGYQTVYRVVTDNTDRAAPELANAPTLDAFYPARAEKGAIGQVRLDCAVTVAGLAKDCEVKDEAPKGQGFGNAALEYAGRSTYLPKRIDGVEQQARLTLDIRLEPGQESAAAAAPPAPPPPPDPPISAGPTP